MESGKNGIKCSVSGLLHPTELSAAPLTMQQLSNLHVNMHACVEGLAEYLSFKPKGFPGKFFKRFQAAVWWPLQQRIVLK